MTQTHNTESFKLVLNSRTAQLNETSNKITTRVLQYDQIRPLRIALCDVTIPITIDVINNRNDSFYFSEQTSTTGMTLYVCKVPHGNYTSSQLVSVLNNVIKQAYPYPIQGGVTSPATTNPKNSYTFEIDNVYNYKVAVKTSGADVNPFVIHHPTYYHRNRQFTNSLNIHQVSFNSSTFTLTIFISGDAHQIQPGDLINRAMIREAASSIQLIISDYSVFAVNTSSNSIDLKYTNDSVWIFSSNSITTTSNSNVHTKSMFNNIAETIGFTTVLNSRDIVQMHDTGVTLLHFTTSKKHHYSATDIIGIYNSSWAPSSRIEAEVQSVIDDYVFTINRSVITTAAGSDPFSIYPNTSMYCKLEDETDQTNRIYYGDDRVNLLQYMQSLFIKCVINDRFEVGELVNGSSFSKYLANITLNGSNNEIIHKTGKELLNGESNVFSASNLSTISVEIVSADLEQPIDLNGVDWSCTLEITGVKNSNDLYWADSRFLRT